MCIEKQCCRLPSCGASLGWTERRSEPDMMMWAQPTNQSIDQSIDRPIHRPIDLPPPQIDRRKTQTRRPLAGARVCGGFHSHDACLPAAYIPAHIARRPRPAPPSHNPNTHPTPTPHRQEAAGWRGARRSRSTCGSCASSSAPPRSPAPPRGAYPLSLSLCMYVHTVGSAPSLVWEVRCIMHKHAATRLRVLCVCERQGPALYL